MSRLDDKESGGVGVYDRGGAAAKAKKTSVWIWLAIVVALILLAVWIFGR